MSEEYEYQVLRPKYRSDDEFQALLNEQGAGGWRLVSLLPEPLPGVGPYLAVFYRQKPV